jgi:hypothetical protein
METHKEGYRPLAPVQSPTFLENVRKAEHLIAAGEYDLALQKLASAQDLEPQNQYMPALIQRVTYLRNTAGKNLRSATATESLPSAVQASSLPLMGLSAALTPAGEQTAAGDHAVDSRVKRLTVVATNLFERGSYEPAFQTLVKALLLAPTHPHVIECQRVLQPAIRLLKERGNVIGLDIVRGAQAQPGETSSTVSQGENDAQMVNASSGSAPGFHRSHAAKMMPAVQEGRLETLKRQKERERSERERAMWRQASGPLKVYGQRIESIGENNQAPSSKESVKQQTGFFAKLKQGKFLG